MTTTIRNLTPHCITMVTTDGEVSHTFPSEGIARATQTNVQVGEVNGIPVMETHFGETVDLPEFQEGTYLIVSIITANAARANGRTTCDLLLTTDTVRDESGRIVGCRAFARI